MAEVLQFATRALCDHAVTENMGNSFTIRKNEIFHATWFHSLRKHNDDPRITPYLWGCGTLLPRDKRKWLILCYLLCSRCFRAAAVLCNSQCCTGLLGCLPLFETSLCLVLLLVLTDFRQWTVVCSKLDTRNSNHFQTTEETVSFLGSSPSVLLVLAAMLMVMGLKITLRSRGCITMNSGKLN